MPRANRIFLPGHAWHITHRCHQREFLLKFAEDRRRWRYWLFEATKRYSLRVLDYIVTSNHIHLLVLDRGEGEIAKSMQLIAGRTAQDYNRRKGRKGAYWEDRYHATAADTDGYLARCMRYIDLNMVRAGVVAHPLDWDVSGYREIQQPPTRYRIIDQDALLDLLNTSTFQDLQALQRNWVDEALLTGKREREHDWTSALAIGSQAFVKQVHEQGGIRLLHRQVHKTGHGWQLREERAQYGDDITQENATLSADSCVFIDLID